MKAVIITLEIIPKCPDFVATTPAYIKLKMDILSTHLPALEDAKKQIVANVAAYEKTRTGKLSTPSSFSSISSTSALPAFPKAPTTALPSASLPPPLPSSYNSTTTSASPSLLLLSTSGTISAPQLHQELCQTYAANAPSSKRILLLDVRPKEDFISGHIKWNRSYSISSTTVENGSGGVVCIEPEWIPSSSTSVLDIDSFLLSFALGFLSPRILFQMRSRCDLIVLYDQSSMSLASNECLEWLAKCLDIDLNGSSVNGRRGQQQAKIPIVLLSGGFDSWRRFAATSLPPPSSMDDVIEIGDGIGEGNSSTSTNIGGGGILKNSSGSAPPSASLYTNSDGIVRSAHHFGLGAASASSRPITSIQQQSSTQPSSSSSSSSHNNYNTPGLAFPSSKIYSSSNSSSSAAAAAAAAAASKVNTNGLNIHRNVYEFVNKQYSPTKYQPPLFKQNSTASVSSTSSDADAVSSPTSIDGNNKENRRFDFNDPVSGFSIMSMSRRRGQELLASSNTASSYSSGFSYPTLQPAVATAVAAPSSAASVQPPPPPQLPPKPQELSIAASNAPAPPPPAVHHQYSNMYRSASADAQLNVMASSMPSRTSSMTPGAVKLDNNRPLAVATNVNGYDRNPRGQGLPQQQPSFTSALGPAARSSSPSHSASTNRYYSPVSSVAPPPPLPPKPRSRATSRAGESSLHSNNMVAGASSSSSSSSLSNNLAVYEDRSVATQNRLSFSQLGSTTVGVVGLKNLGNTCFLNSIIQCLSATVPLSRYFLGGSFRRHINRANTFGSRGEIAETYSQLVKTMWSEQDPIVTPIRFKDIVGKFAPQFQGNEQHDSQEFLIFLLDAIHEDLNLGRRRVPGKEEEEDKEEPDFIASEKAWNLYSQSNWSIIVDMFQGQMRSKLTCLSCNKSSTTFNAYMYLTLPIPEVNSVGVSGGPVYLQECLDKYLETETLTGDDMWHCSRCKQPRKSTKQLSLTTLPNILLIHLKRFYFQGPFRNKIETYVEFPVNVLDMSQYLPDYCKNKQEFQYDLYAISNHYGGLNGGHYTAQVKNGYKQQWFNFDDSRISGCSESALKSKSAYILFYVKRGTTIMKWNWWESTPSANSARM